MATDADAWRDLISRARKNFDGEITFAANWPDGAAAVAFWDRLDYVGIDAYMPLETRDTASPAVDDLVRAWREPIAQMRALHEKWDLPVLLTELGYESRPGTAARVDGEGVDQGAQADAYEAAFQASPPPLDGRDLVVGVVGRADRRRPRRSRVQPGGQGGRADPARLAGGLSPAQIDCLVGLISISLMLT